MIDSLDLINLSIYIKLHQVNSEDALKFTGIDFHHLNVYVNQPLIWLRLCQHNKVKAS